MDIKELISRAEAGDPAAQTDLGICYIHGNGVEVDEAKAFFWYLKAAEQGEPSALTNAGECYMYGIGTNKNIENAIVLLSKACELDIPEAQSSLGAIYITGEGIPADPEKAVALFTRAAKHKLPEAFGNLGRCYLEGIGVDKNLAKALEYFCEERNYGEINESNYRYICNKIDIDELSALSDNGNAKAQCFLGCMYLDGIVKSDDNNLSVGSDLVIEAAQQGEPFACFLVGTTAYNREDYLRADMYFERAVKAGWRNAAFKLAEVREKLIENGTYFLVKILKKEFARKFRKGEIYMRSIREFGRIEKEMNDERGDAWEGKLLPLTEKRKMGGIGRVSELRKIFCMYSLDVEQGSHSQVSEKVKEFGDTAIVITDVNEFIRRYSIACEKKYGQGHFVRYDRVRYEADLYEWDKYHEFLKRVRYSNQREFRLVLDVSNGKLPLSMKTDWLLSQGCAFDDNQHEDFEVEVIQLDIGCIQDISIEISVDEFIANVGKHIREFMPPQKVETRYFCPSYTEGLSAVFADLNWKER